MPASPTTPIVEGLRLLRRVGSGGEGEVWEARDPAGRPRAFKLIRPQMLADPVQVAQRARQLRRIDHPALVRVHRSGILESGRLAGWGYVEMDYVDGVPLDEAPPDPEALLRLAPLAQALDLLHAGEWSDGVPLVHRDVKPGNLIETPDGDVVLVDPSTLRGLDSEAHTRIGTPLFCAPEVLRGKVTPAADVYSFAATLVALASGTRGDELAELLDDPSGLELPSGVMRALSPRPSDRPRSCQAVLTAAEELTRVFPDADGWLADPDGPAGAGHTVILRGEAGERERDVAPGLDGIDDFDGGPVPAGSALPWAVAFGALVVAPIATWVGPRPDALPVVLALSVALHLVLHVAARRPLWPAVLAPPLAWADLLAERAVSRPRRQEWAATMLLAGVTGALVPAALRLTGEGGSAGAVTATTAAAVVAVAGLAHLPRMRGPEAAVMRVLLAPVWAAGLALLFAGAIVALPVALIAGRAGELFLRLGRALAGTVEIFLPPR